MQKYFIYQLIDPATQKPFYVGVTKKTLAERLAIHMWCAKNRPYGFISEYIGSMSTRPSIEILETIKGASFESARIRELYWVKVLEQKGFNLTNCASPYRNEEPVYVKASKEELDFLRLNRGYLAVINKSHGIGLRPQDIYRVLKTGGCTKYTLEKIRKFISAVNALGVLPITTRHTIPMVQLNADQLEKLNTWKLSVNLEKNCPKIGIHENTIRNVLKSGMIRHNLFDKLSAIFQ